MSLQLQPGDEFFNRQFTEASIFWILQTALQFHPSWEHLSLMTVFLAAGGCHVQYLMCSGVAGAT